MISTKLLIYLAIGTSVMLIPILVQARWQGTKPGKSFLLALILTIMGTIGTYILFFVENRWIGGTSFYGAVFFVPIPFLLVAKLLREPYGQLVDLCAPAECAMLMVMKIQCTISGCCGGRLLYIAADGTEVLFPSQIAELLNAFILMVVLLILARRKPKRGDLYPLYMLIYGISRFVLNLFRANQTAFLLGLPAGNFWSLISVATGLIWLFVLRRSVAAKCEMV